MEDIAMANGNTQPRANEGARPSTRLTAVGTTAPREERVALEADAPSDAPARESLAERAASEQEAAERAATIDTLARRNAELAHHTGRGAVGPTGRIALVIGVAAAAALAAGWMVFVALAP
jgi:hypothetical protein